MEPWQSLLLAFGGNVALLVVLGWLTRSVVQHWLTKDVEQFKATLLAESASASEQLKHELGLAAVEHNVRFSKLHERRAEVIAELYGLLVEAYWALHSFVSPVEWSSDDPKRKKYADAMAKASDFFRYFDKNRIFLPVDLCVSLDTFIQGMRGEAIGFGVWVQMEYVSENASQEKHKAWMKAWSYFDSEAPKARLALESELRAILGPSSQISANIT